MAITLYYFDVILSIKLLIGEGIDNSSFIFIYDDKCSYFIPYCSEMIDIKERIEQRLSKNVLLHPLCANDYDRVKRLSWQC